MLTLGAEETYKKPPKAVLDVLDNNAMPVVGADPDSVNNTYIEQIVADAKAAIDKLRRWA